MKNLFRNTALLGLCLAATIFVSCKPEPKEEEMELKKGTTTLELDAGVSCVIPEWTKNPKGKSDLPDVIDNGSASNVNLKLMAGIKKLPAKDIPVKNVIVMFFDNLSDTLIDSAEKKYGELIINDLPQKMSFTASTVGENASEDKVLGLYLGDACYKTCGYATTGVISNPVFRQLKGTLAADSADKDVIYNMIITTPRPIIVIAKDTAKEETKAECALSSPSYTNEIYKSRYKFTPDFAEAVSYYKNEEVYFQGMDEYTHPDKKAEANGIFNASSPSATVLPSAVQEVKYSLTWMETKAEEEGFAFMFYDSAERADKEAALKNFDESVAVAAKYVLENPDTILVVTSGSLDGSKVPAFALGNNVETGKNCANLLDFVKTTIKSE